MSAQTANPNRPSRIHHIYTSGVKSLGTSHLAFDGFIINAHLGGLAVDTHRSEQSRDSPRHQVTLIIVELRVLPLFMSFLCLPWGLFHSCAFFLFVVNCDSSSTASFTILCQGCPCRMSVRGALPSPHFFLLDKRVHFALSQAAKSMVSLVCSWESKEKIKYATPGRMCR